MSRIDAVSNIPTPSDGGVVDAVTDVALRVGQAGLPGLGPLGYVAGVPFSLIVADRDAETKLQTITNEYRGEIAAYFGVPPAHVSSQLMVLMANKHEGIANAIKAVKWEQDAHSWVNAAGVGGMAAGAAAGAAVVTGPLGWLALGVGSLVGSFAGEAIGHSLWGADEKLNPNTYMHAIKEKLGRASVKEIAAEVFRLRVAQNKGLQEHIAHAQGAEFFAMSAEDQLAVMNTMRPLLDVCLADAQAATQPGANVNRLMFGGLADSPVIEFAQQGVSEFRGQKQPSDIVVPESWAERVGGSRPTPGVAWADRVTQPAFGGSPLPSM